MSKTERVIYIVLIIGLILYIASTNKETKNNDKKIDSIHYIRDSITNIINTNNSQIKEINESYIKTKERIIHQSYDSDYVFFTKYLQGYSDSLNSKGTKDN